MIIRKAAAAAIISAVMFGTGAAMAAPQQDGAPTSFATQLNEAKAALTTSLSGGTGRSERIVASRSLEMAEYLYQQGQVTKAQPYLNLARGKLGLATDGGAPVVAYQAFTKDFYNPIR